MAAENAALSEPHRDSARHPAEQLQDLPLVAEHRREVLQHTHHRQPPSPPLLKPQRPLHVTTTSVATSAAAAHGATSKKKKTTAASSEKTPLVLKIDTSRRSDEEVHPLPWFRSPEWTRRSPLTDKGRAGSGRTKRGRGASDPTSSSSTWWCFGESESSGRRRDVELGYSSSYHRRVRAASADDADGFRQCIQFLVALIVVVAMALIFMVIFEPFHESSASAAAAAAAGADGDSDGGGW